MQHTADIKQSQNKMELLELATNFGIPAAISLYLVWWLTQRHEKTLLEVKGAITNQTKVLNHTLTKMITQSIKDKEELKKITSQNTKGFMKELRGIRLNGNGK